jgi:hypothetical protein
MRHPHGRVHEVLSIPIKSVNFTLLNCTFAAMSFKSVCVCVCEYLKLLHSCRALESYWQST